MAEDPGQIREAIETTRAEIAETIEALGAKADVKTRLSDGVREKTDELRSKLSTLDDQAKAHLPESAHPAVDATVTQARHARDLIAADPNRQRAVYVGFGLVAMLLLARRRRRRS